MTATVQRSYDETLAAAREALATQGFGVLTEIDLAGTLRAKLGVEVARQVILGACRPQAAYAAITADPSVATLLPCNVVVREVDATTTVVEAFDPSAMTLIGGDALADVATEVRGLLTTALAAVAAVAAGALDATGDGGR
nr:DUF302 domain-containing protein [Nocardioides zeae]